MIEEISIDMLNGTSYRTLKVNAMGSRANDVFHKDLRIITFRIIISILRPYI